MGKTYGKNTPSEFVRGGEVQGREAVRRSATISWRRANPVNMTLAEAVPNFVYDYTTQQAHQPHIVKGLSSKGNSILRSTNLSGGMSLPHSGMRKVRVGSGSDDKGKF